MPKFVGPRARFLDVVHLWRAEPDWPQHGHHLGDLFVGRATIAALLTRRSGLGEIRDLLPCRLTIEAFIFRVEWNEGKMSPIVLISHDIPLPAANVKRLRIR
ncbi:MAG: hypothetical protein WAM85_16720 [Terracidiphilus sp.]